jgi:hypothetical protein
MKIWKGGESVNGRLQGVGARNMHVTEVFSSRAVVVCYTTYVEE